jgi:transposase
MRIAPAVAPNDDDLLTLRRWSCGRSTPARLVLRAKVILAAIEGKTNDLIAEELGTDAGLVGRWRRRFAAGGLASIEKDAPRGGRPATSRSQMAGTIIEWTTCRKPKNATHWSTRTLAAELGTSRAMDRVKGTG